MIIEWDLAHHLHCHSQPIARQASSSHSGPARDALCAAPSARPSHNRGFGPSHRPPIPPQSDLIVMGGAKWMMALVPRCACCVAIHCSTNNQRVVHAISEGRA